MEMESLPIIPVGVKDAPFTLDLLANDCPPTQFVREFTVNGIEAIASYREHVDADFCGEVVWSVDPSYEQLGLMKLACIDSGVGMGDGEMPEYLNDLVASGKPRGLGRNYGIGAKISAAVGNPLGVVYASWKEGLGHMVELGRDETGTWGMRQHRLKSGDVRAVVPLSIELKPSELSALDHGTIVTFLGAEEAEDTTLAPSGEKGERWIAKILNQRFYDIPEWVTIRARELRVAGHEAGARFRTVRGQRYFLDQHTQAQGRVEVEGASVHWRILRDNHDERSRDSGVWASTGHRACLFQGELFEMATAARGGYEKLKEFGIRFGYERVVLYVEPHADGNHVTQDTVRSRVKIDGEPIPWTTYAEEFEAKMPPELEAFQEAIAAGARHHDHNATIRERLADIADLFQIPRYRPQLAGANRMDTPNLGGQAGELETQQRSRHGWPTRTNAGTAGNVYALFEDDRGQAAREVSAKALPDITVDWISLSDGTRALGYLDDRAASYDRRRNRLEVNADFRGYTDVLRRWEGRYKNVAGAPALIEEITASWWQQGLQETVFGVLALRGSEHWDERTVQEALSDSALTAASMPRYHLDAVLRRELGNRLGPTRAAA